MSLCRLLSRKNNCRYNLGLCSTTNNLLSDRERLATVLGISCSGCQRPTPVRPLWRLKTRSISDSYWLTKCEFIWTSSLTLGSNPRVLELRRNVARTRSKKIRAATGRTPGPQRCRVRKIKSVFDLEKIANVSIRAWKLSSSVILLGVG